MRLLILIMFMAAPFAWPQQTPENAATVLPIVTQARAAFTGGKHIDSVLLRGSVRTYTGKGVQEGSITLVAEPSGLNQVTEEFPDGKISEGQTGMGVGRKCSWAGKDGISHQTASVNCFTAVPWFLPQIALLSESSPAIQTVDGGETNDGPESGAYSRLLRHSLTVQTDNKHKSAADQIAVWSQAELRLDTQTNLPKRLDFTLGSEHDSRLKIQSRTTFSDYQTVSGVVLPFHIKRYLNGALLLDIIVTEAEVR